MKNFLAIDIGASSGRHILFSEDGSQKEIFRFPNGVKEQNGHLVWDIDEIIKNVKKGIEIAVLECDVTSLSIDTWGVDYVLVKEDGDIVRPVYAYRDFRSKEVIDEVHSIVPFDELYERTGCQKQDFTTIYQLYWDLKNGRLNGVSDFLMLPEYLMFVLCGRKAKEFTEATTTGLLNAHTMEFDMELVRRLGFPKHLFNKTVQPGFILGKEEHGINVVLCATHDTASAVEGIPMEGNYPYISSGTWSLLGIKTEKPITTKQSLAGNWSNEGGVGYNRYQKNIMGMWLINRLRDELCPGKDFVKIASEASESKFMNVVDAQDARFLAPDSMKEEFKKALNESGTDISLMEERDFFACAYRSLAVCYAKSLVELEENTGKKYDRLYIVGGGAKNGFLNALTEEYSGRKVIALPIEATALGNFAVQKRVFA